MLIIFNDIPSVQLKAFLAASKHMYLYGSTDVYANASCKCIYSVCWCINKNASNRLHWFVLWSMQHVQHMIINRCCSFITGIFPFLISWLELTFKFICFNISFILTKNYSPNLCVIMYMHMVRCIFDMKWQNICKIYDF